MKPPRERQMVGEFSGEAKGSKATRSDPKGEWRRQEAGGRRQADILKRTDWSLGILVR